MFHSEKPGTLVVRAMRPAALAKVLGLCLALAAPTTARADSFTGEDWIVRFNLPDQTTSYSKISPDEFVLRDAWLARIDALQANDSACLSTYTFSGPSASCGAAGPILGAISNALARGAKIGFVVGKDVDVATNFWTGCSLQSLSIRSGNALRLAQAPSTGIMHNKLGVFWYNATREPWVLSGSWNFTGGASSEQWNVLVEIRNAELATAVSNELAQLLGGHFHDDKTKSHEPDDTHFRLDSSPAESWIRFAPYPDGNYGGNNALRDITNAIAHATNSIYFSLNKLSRADVVDQLILACNRGVTVQGTIPKSDRSNPSGASYAMYTNLLYSPAYTTGNRVQLYDAWYSTERAKYDSTNRDLVHTKYMLIDPFGAKPMVIHGSANWTAAGLVQTSSNDENVLFLSHRRLALAFLAQFIAETGVPRPWIFSVVPGRAGLDISYWLPVSANSWALEMSPSLTKTNWGKIKTLSTTPGTNTVSVATTNSTGFFLIRDE